MYIISQFKTFPKLLLLALFSASTFSLKAQSDLNINELKKEFDKIKQNQTSTHREYVNQEDFMQSSIEEFRVKALQLNNQDSLGSNITNFFGYKFFENNNDFEFWDNLPITSDYVLGSGDEVILSLWGETQLRRRYIISRDGKIYDERAGLLSLSGKSIKEAEKYLYNEFSKVFSTLKGKSPKTFMDITLGEIKSINVNFVGEVKFPGVYPLHPFSNVISGLIQIGGPDTTGSLREVSIIRDGNKYQTVDIYDYLLRGSTPKNIQLRDQDIVLVPPRLSNVFIDSSIVRSGIYELKPNENISNLIEYAGGLTHESSSIIAIKSIRSELNGYYDLTKNNTVSINNGDSVIVLPVLKSVSRVELIGQVKRPGKYVYYSGMKASDLIKLGGGFEDPTFLKSVFLNRAEIVSLDKETRYETVKAIDLNQIIRGANDYELNNLDKLVVHANLNFFEKKNVHIRGEINVPGSYPIIKDNESLQSIVNRAGGFTNKAFDEGIEIKRDSMKVAWKNMNIQIFPGDSITINEKPGVVYVTGEVYNEGLVEFQAGRTVNYYINAAGGATQDGDKNNTTIEYANGFVVPKRRFVPLQVRDGSKITVNRKNKKEPINFTDIANIASTTLTILVLINQLNAN